VCTIEGLNGHGQTSQRETPRNKIRKASPRSDDYSVSLDNFIRTHTPAKRLEITLSRSDGTPVRLQVDSLDTSLDHAVPDIVKSGQSVLDIGSSPVGKSLSGPEHLSRSSSTRPCDGVKVLRPRLLGPEELLTAEDEVSLVRSDALERVEGVGVLPSLEGVAPGVSTDEVTEPTTTSTVEVEVVTRSVYDSESFLRNGGGIVRADPDEDDSVRAESNVVRQHHLFPDNGSLPRLGEDGVLSDGELAQSLFEGKARSLESSLSRSVVVVTLLVDLVATGGKPLGGEHAGEGLDEGDGEVAGGRYGESELTRGRFIGNGIVVRGGSLLTGDVLGVSISND